MVGGSVVVAAAGFSFYKASGIQSFWADFDQNRSEKGRVLNALRKQIGFGGMIHNYKNYILRKNEDNKEKVLFSLGGAKAKLAEYKTLPLNKDELAAIGNVYNTLSAYESALATISKKNAEGLAAKEIDKLVIIDDRLAFSGMETLEKNIKLHTAFIDLKHGDEQLGHSLENSKVHLIAEIREKLGYGGMIHFYKNYILRHDIKYKNQAAINLALAIRYVDIYSGLELNEIEKHAINALKLYLGFYKKRLNELEKLVTHGLSPRQIDKKVKVDDRPILNALISLEKQTILFDEARALKLNDSIEFIVFSTKFIGFVSLIIFLMIAIGSYWLVKLKIVKPIVGLIDVMKKLAKNDFNIKILGADSDNEIGDMAKSIEFFKSTAKARIETDKELIRLNAELEQRVRERSQKLEDNQKLLTAIVETAVDGIIVFNDSGIIKSFNDAAVNMFGRARESAIGDDITAFIPSLYGYINEDGDVSFLDVGRELRAIREDGTGFPIEVAIGGFSLHGQRMFASVIRDVSERHFHEEQIRRSQKMDALGKLTGGIAHDYNNMLGIILGYAKLMKRKLDSDDKLFSYADEIYKAGQRGESLTSKLLDFSRHKPAAEKQQVNINELLYSMEDMLQKTLTARIELSYQFLKELWDVKVDVADLENALLNMSINAMHAMDGSGKLIISTTNFMVGKHLSSMLGITPGDYVKMSIIDTGFGMNDETKSHIFDPFFSTKDDKGTGLGLSQVYGFVQRSSGAIVVYSELGKGSNFTLYLPRDAEGVEDELGDKSIDSISYRGDEAILIVDDEEGLVKLAEEILSSYGYTTYTALNGFEALEVLADNKHIDLILTDIVMPKMDGFALAKEVKLRYPDILIQFSSGYNTATPETLEYFSTEEMISKPYSEEQLVKKIRWLLDSKKTA